MKDTRVNLSKFSSHHFDRGKCKVIEWSWRFLSACIFQSPFVSNYGIKRWLLRCYGATIGKGVLIKPRVTITFPWRLTMGDHVWIGEGVWLDNLDTISIGSHTCISQGAYLCTGNHDYTLSTFDLKTKPIVIGQGVWIAAKSIVAPGVLIHDGSILCLGSVITTSMEQDSIYQGNPAYKVGSRKLVKHQDPENPS